MRMPNPAPSPNRTSLRPATSQRSGGRSRAPSRSRIGLQTRWLDYELDIAKLLDFPLMTDMRNPLTVRFHQAKLRADLLRPAKAEDLLDDRDAAGEYLDAVENYVTAFNVAEAEAI